MTPKVQSIEDTGTSIDKPFTGVKYTCSSLLCKGSNFLSSKVEKEAIAAFGSQSLTWYEGVVTGMFSLFFFASESILPL